ncbi:MAG: 4Fe-4S binding protein [Bacillota bacterium]
MSKALRKIIKIDEEKCDGCGLCIPSCAEGALQVIDGKARLIEDRFCDGLGNCLGECPQGAIEIIEREAAPFDETAVEEHLRNQASSLQAAAPCACAGSMERAIRQETRPPVQPVSGTAEPLEAELSHWPIQLHLVPPQARFLQGQDLLISADCVSYAFADFHRQLLKGKSLIIGCPKLDDVNSYHQKLIEIFKQNEIKSITLAYMEVPCCHGLVQMVRSALKQSGKEIPVREVVVTVDGKIKQES